MKTTENDNIISLPVFKVLNDNRRANNAYTRKIQAMSKVELLEEMVRFQQKRSSLGHLTIDLMLKGQILFRAIEENAETEELTILSRSYRRHLDFELKEMLKNKAVMPDKKTEMKSQKVTSKF